MATIRIDDVIYALSGEAKRASLGKRYLTQRAIGMLCSELLIEQSTGPVVISETVTDKAVEL